MKNDMVEGEETIIMQPQPDKRIHIFVDGNKHRVITKSSPKPELKIMKHEP